jgi:hypothetical protein
MTAVVLVGLVVSILAGYLLADLAYTRVNRPRLAVPAVIAPVPDAYRTPVLTTERALSDTMMRRMEGLHQAINCSVLTPAEARKHPDVSWVEFEKVRW